MSSGPVESSSVASAAARLCVTCGLCCDGSFFGFVELKPEDDAAILAALLPLERREDKNIFRQPCPALKGTCCQVYAQRPHVCRKYRCRVLRGVEDEPSGLPVAQEKVSSLRAAFAALKSQLQQAGFSATDAGIPAAIKAFRSAYAQAFESGDRAFFTRHGELVLRWKKTAWLMQAFDEKAAARLALPHSAAIPSPPS